MHRYCRSCLTCATHKSRPKSKAPLHPIATPTPCRESILTLLVLCHGLEAESATFWLRSAVLQSGLRHSQFPINMPLFVQGCWRRTGCADMVCQKHSQWSGKKHRVPGVWGNVPFAGDQQTAANGILSRGQCTDWEPAQLEEACWRPELKMILRVGINS